MYPDFKIGEAELTFPTILAEVLGLFCCEPRVLKLGCLQHFLVVVNTAGGVLWTLIYNLFVAGLESRALVPSKDGSNPARVTDCPVSLFVYHYYIQTHKITRNFIDTEPHW